MLPAISAALVYSTQQAAGHLDDLGAVVGGLILNHERPPCRIRVLTWDHFDLRRFTGLCA